jgi:hydrogenase maturation protease
VEPKDADDPARAGIVLLAGMGNPDCGDDAVGVAVVRNLRGRLPANVRVEELRDDALRLASLAAECSRIVLVDAIVSGSRPGTVRRFAGPDLAGFRSHRPCSTHSLRATQALRLASVLGEGRPEVVLVGVEWSCFEPGTPMTREVRAAIEGAARAVLRELQASAAA